MFSNIYANCQSHKIYSCLNYDILARVCHIYEKPWTYFVKIIKQEISKMLAKYDYY